MTDLDPDALNAAQALVASANPYLKTAMEGVTKEVIAAYLVAAAETPRAKAEREVMAAALEWWECAFEDEDAMLEKLSRSISAMKEATHG